MRPNSRALDGAARQNGHGPLRGRRRRVGGGRRGVSGRVLLHAGPLRTRTCKSGCFARVRGQRRRRLLCSPPSMPASHAEAASLALRTVSQKSALRPTEGTSPSSASNSARASAWAPARGNEVGDRAGAGRSQSRPPVWQRHPSSPSSAAEPQARTRCRQQARLARGLGQQPQHVAVKGGTARRRRRRGRRSGSRCGRRMRRNRRRCCAALARRGRRLGLGASRWRGRRRRNVLGLRQASQPWQVRLRRRRGLVCRQERRGRRRGRLPAGAQAGGAGGGGRRRAARGGSSRGPAARRSAHCVGAPRKHTGGLQGGGARQHNKEGAIYVKLQRHGA